MESSTNKYKILLNKFFNKEANAEEIAALVEWMRSTKTPEDFDNYCKELWDTSSNAIDKEIDTEIWDVITEKVMEKKKRFKISPMFYRIAAAVLLPICLIMGASLLFMVKEENKRASDTFEVLVDKGQKASVTLPDGTKTWVNSGSRLRYSYSESERKVNLDGEAYFEVAHNPDSKFVVSCNHLDVEALGTIFVVKGYNSDEVISVALIEGKVNIKVSNDASNTILTPNQGLQFNKKSKEISRTEIKDIREVDFWRRNILYFRSQTLADIANTLERMYGITVKFEDDELKGIPFSGSINNNSLSNVFHIISLTYPISYKIENDVVTIRNEKKK